MLSNNSCLTNTTRVDNPKKTDYPLLTLKFKYDEPLKKNIVLFLKAKISKQKKQFGLTMLETCGNIIISVNRIVYNFRILINIDILQY